MWESRNGETAAVPASSVPAPVRAWGSASERRRHPQPVRHSGKRVRGPTGPSIDVVRAHEHGRRTNARERGVEQPVADLVGDADGMDKRRDHVQEQKGPDDADELVDAEEFTFEIVVEELQKQRTRRKKHASTNRKRQQHLNRAMVPQQPPPSSRTEQEGFDMLSRPSTATSVRSSGTDRRESTPVSSRGLVHTHENEQQPTCRHEEDQGQRQARRQHGNAAVAGGQHRIPPSARFFAGSRVVAATHKGHEDLGDGDRVATTQRSARSPRYRTHPSTPGAPSTPPPALMLSARALHEHSKGQSPRKAPPFVPALNIRSMQPQHSGADGPPSAGSSVSGSIRRGAGPSSARSNWSLRSHRSRVAPISTDNGAADVLTDKEQYQHQSQRTGTTLLGMHTSRSSDSEDSVTPDSGVVGGVPAGSAACGENDEVDIDDDGRSSGLASSLDPAAFFARMDVTPPTQSGAGLAQPACANGADHYSGEDDSDDDDDDDCEEDDEEDYDEDYDDDYANDGYDNPDELQDLAELEESYVGWNGDDSRWPDERPGAGSSRHNTAPRLGMGFSLSRDSQDGDGSKASPRSASSNGSAVRRYSRDTDRSASPPTTSWMGRIGSWLGASNSRAAVDTPPVSPAHPRTIAGHGRGSSRRSSSTRQSTAGSGGRRSTRNGPSGSAFRDRYGGSMLPQDEFA